MQNENIKLSLPINAAYVSAARLTASSIANRLNFDIDEIEDIKAAVSEACTFIIKHAPIGIAEDFTVQFHIVNDVVKIIISTNFIVDSQADEDEMGLTMIKALMDDFVLANFEKSAELCMVKKHKALFFD